MPMRVSNKVRRILQDYSHEAPGVQAKLAQILMTGRLGGTGRMIILPVDQGVEHGPARSFAVNAPGYDPVYHHRLAIEARLNAHAAPLGHLEVSSPAFPGQIPTILKVNHSNSLFRSKTAADQAQFATVEDALRLGCSAVGFTIYPGSDQSLEMMEEVGEMVRRARSFGLPSVIWAYPRGGDLSKQGETALDVTAYGAHMSAQLGAHIIKVKLPTDHLEQDEAKKQIEKAGVARKELSDRVAEVKRSCFAGKRLVVFSGGAAKDDAGVMDDVRAIYKGGGNGSIVGRNTFQRPHDEAIKLLDNMTNVLLGKA